MDNELVDVMSKSIGKDVAVFQKFLLQYGKMENTLFYFIEGEDFDYYNVRIKKNVYSKNIIDYSCEGKKNVVGVRNLIKEKLCVQGNNSLKFFVDKDYGFETIPEDIYITDWYSIENFYLTEDIVFNIIENILKVNKTSENFKKCQSYFKQTYKEYSKFAKQMNTFFYTIREKEKIEGLKRSNFNQFKLTKFIENADLCSFKMKILSFEELLEMYNIEYSIEKITFKKNSVLFDENDHSNFRGKFELEYLKWFLNSIRESIASGKNDLLKNKTCRYDFSTDCMLILTDYAITPQSLIDYILKDEKLISDVVGTV
mgnify:CR=1 FL=1